MVGARVDHRWVLHRNEEVASLLRGLYTGASGMLVEQHRTDVIANNIANVDTVGFKEDRLRVQAFPEMLLQRINDLVRQPAGQQMDSRPTIGRLGTGAFVEDVWTSMEPGNVRYTGNPLDVALADTAFFAVETPEGLRFTRDGSFRLDGDGFLATHAGNWVLGQNGPIPILGEQVQIDSAGRVIVDDELVDQLLLVEFPEPWALDKQGHNLWVATEEAGPPELADVEVMAQHLEGSNVRIVPAMVEMITAYRAYEANQRVIQAHDETLGQAVNDIAAL